MHGYKKIDIFMKKKKNNITSSLKPRTFRFLKTCYKFNDTLELKQCPLYKKIFGFSVLKLPMQRHPAVVVAPALEVSLPAVFLVVYTP